MGFSDLLNQNITVQRSTVSVITAGETVQTWVTLTTVRGAIQQARGRKILGDPGREMSAEWFAFLPVSLDVQEGDRLVEGDRTFDVLLLENLRGHHQEARLRVVNVP